MSAGRAHERTFKFRDTHVFVRPIFRAFWLASGKCTHSDAFVGPPAHSSGMSSLPARVSALKPLLQVGARGGYRRQLQRRRGDVRRDLHRAQVACFAARARRRSRGDEHVVCPSAHAASDMRPCVMRRVHAMCTHAALKVGRNRNATEAVHTTPRQVGVQLGVRAAVLRGCVAGGGGGQLPGR